MCRYRQTNLICKRHKHRKIEWWQPAKKIVVHKNSRKNWFASIIIQIKKKGGGRGRHCRDICKTVEAYISICHTPCTKSVTQTNYRSKPPPRTIFFWDFTIFFILCPWANIRACRKGLYSRKRQFYKQKRNFIDKSSPAWHT